MVYPMTNEIELQALSSAGGPVPNVILLRLLGKKAKTTDLCAAIFSALEAQRSAVLVSFPKRGLSFYNVTQFSIQIRKPQRKPPK